MRKYTSAAIFVMFTMLLYLICTAAAGFPYTFLESGYGEKLPSLDVRSLAMGRTAIASGNSPFALRTNPALLASLGGISMEFTGTMITHEEKRSFPVHDSFSSYIVDNVYAHNSHHYYQVAGAFSGGTNSFLKHGGGSPFFPAVALGYYPLYDFHFTYEEEVRDNYSFAGDKDALLGYNRLISDGYLTALSLGLAWDVVGLFQAGFAVSLLNGDIDQSSSIIYEKDSPSLVDSIVRGDVSLKGTSVSFGASSEIGSRIRTGVTCELPVTIDAERKTVFHGSDTPSAVSKGEIIYPMSIGVGLQYSPRNVLRTTVAFDVIREFWSDFEDSEGVGGEFPFFDSGDSLHTSFEDITVYHIGLEHVFYNDIPVWFGFSHYPDRGDSRILSSVLSAGTGFYISGAFVKLGGEFGWRTYRQDDLFADSLYDDATESELYDRTEQDRVEEKFLGGYLSIQYNFDL
jgi:hypothetical protein